MSEIQRRDFLTGAAALRPPRPQHWPGRRRAGPPEADDKPPEPIRGKEGATDHRPDEPRARGPEPGQAHAAGDGQRHAARP